jgi:CubicO group peptidase (beta-lactamase class C family)
MNLRRCSALALSALLGSPLLIHPALAALPDDAASLAGIWGVQRVTLPEIAGAVTVVRTGSTWRAYAAGFAADGTLVDGLPTFRFPGDRGELRVDLPHAAGYWVQPPDEMHYSPYASALQLTALGPNAWRGTIAPLAARVEAYLVIAPGADGTMQGFLRDPNGNAGLRTAFTRVLLEGERVRLVTAKAEYTGTLDAKHEKLSLALPRFSGTLEFTRRDALHAPGFYPRTPMPPRPVAQRPLPAGDGWPVDSLAAVGMKAAPVEALLERLLAAPVTSARAPYVQSVLIARHGKLVVDEYFYGFGADTPHDIRSAGKTIDDALLGIAMFRGARLDATTPIAPFYRRYAPFANPDPRKERVTLGNLITMASGFACDDNNDDSPGQEDHIQETARDWYRATLDLPLAYDPGSRATYCSQGLNLVGGVLTESTRTWLPAFFDRTFARPLEFGSYYVPIMPTGTMYLGGGEYVVPRDFLKFGQLFLDCGVWKGRRLMSRDWVARSLQPHSALNGPGDYGYTWHISHFTVGGKTYVAQSAGGNGGQLMFVIPQLDLVAVITAGNYGDYATWAKFADLIPQYVIPAAT